MRTPEEIIGADAVAALEAEGYTVEEKETYPRRTHWVDAEGKEHPIENYSFSQEQWRSIYGGSPASGRDHSHLAHWFDAEGREHHWERMCNTFVEIVDEAGSGQ